MNSDNLELAAERINRIQHKDGKCRFCPPHAGENTPRNNRDKNCWKSKFKKRKQYLVVS
jgi:hypothetical protein